MPENPSSTPSNSEPSLPPDGRRFFVGPPIQPSLKDLVGRDKDLKQLKHRLGIRKGRQFGSDDVYPNPKLIKELREARGWNIPEFAKEIESRCPRVREWYADIGSLVRRLRRFENEARRRRTDEGDLLTDVAKTLGVSLDQIIDPNPPAQLPDHDRTRVILRGLPGVGKSTLAAVLCTTERMSPASSRTVCSGRRLGRARTSNAA